MEWERIDDYYKRAKVFRGWLVEGATDVTHNMPDDRGMTDGWDWRIALTFVPDFNHEWMLS